jgi:hypothetical protein
MIVLFTIGQVIAEAIKISYPILVVIGILLVILLLIRKAIRAR